MKRRKFMKWLIGVSAAIALDPVIGGQAIWGTTRPEPLGLKGSVELADGFVYAPYIPLQKVPEFLEGPEYLDPWKEIQDKLVATLAIPPEYMQQIMRPPFMFRDFDPDKVAAELGLPREYVFPSEPATPEVKRFLKRVKPSAELVERQGRLAREIEELLASDGRGPSGLARYSKTKLRKDYYDTLAITITTEPSKKV